jgi:DNA-binding SARP family transcriptional activator
LAGTLQALATARANSSDTEPDSAEDLEATGDEPPTTHNLNALDRIEIGTQKGDPVFLDLMTPSGISVTGPGANEVVRAWCLAAFVQAGVGRFELLSTATTGAALFPGLPVSQAVRLAEGSNALLRGVEAEVFSRRRRLLESGKPDIASYRDAHPEDPVAFLIVVIETLDGTQTERFALMLATLDGLDIGVLILGPDNHAATRISVDADRTVAATAGNTGGPSIGAQLHGVARLEASELLAAVIGATEEPEPEDGAGNEPIQPPLARGSTTRTTPEIGALEVPATDDRPRPVEIKILGPYRIFVNGEEVTKGLRSAAKELLAWYLLRPQGASAEAAVEALWPETDPALVSKRFWLALGNLRPRLRDPSGLYNTDILFKSGGRYMPDADAISCDLWAFQRHLVQVSDALDPQAVATLLGKAVAAYGGDFAEGLDYFWAEGLREDVHQRALDAHLRLAEFEEASGREDLALAVLARACEIKGSAEESSRRLMILQDRLGRADAVVSTWQRLQRRLAELEIDPEPATVRLYRQLVGL